MKTSVYKISGNTSDVETEYIKEAGAVIRNGGLVAFPTETVYGLGGNALLADASEKIYKAKGRPSDNPLIVHISSMDEMKPLVQNIPDSAYALAKEFWPGPLTMILNKSEIVPYETTGGLSTVAIRMPSHPVALAFIKEAGVPIAAPSANVSGRPSPTKAEHVVCDLFGKIDVILDGGIVDIGLESTIVDLSGDVPMILRPGYIDQKMLEDVLGRVDRDPTLDKKVTEELKPKAPGMMYRHYAPKGELQVVKGDMSLVVDKINELMRMHAENEVGVITTSENSELYKYGKVVCVGMRENEESVARELYSALRTMDEFDIKYIYVESFYGGRLGDAIMNRLMKAAGHNVISL